MIKLEGCFLFLFPVLWQLYSSTKLLTPATVGCDEHNKFLICLVVQHFCLSTVFSFAVNFSGLINFDHLL